MNSLNIDLKAGQKVVMGGMCGMSEATRTVTVKSGFGMFSFTGGTALYVEFLDGTTGRMDATEIEKVVEEEPKKIEEHEHGDEAPCDRGCGGMMTWCSGCGQYTSQCCVDYGTCQCS